MVEEFEYQEGIFSCDDELEIDFQNQMKFIPFKDFVSSDEPMIFQYLFLNLLGEGSHGKVYLCRDTETKIEYAAKVYNKASLGVNGSISIDDLMSKISSEISIMEKLEHPNCLRFFDAIDDEMTNSVIIIIELAPFGQLMPDRLVYKKFPEREAKKIIKQIASAVDFLHKKNIIHRDIKGQNIFKMSEDRFVLGDYSVSIELPDDDYMLDDTEGTPLFFSPEESSGKPYKGKPSDIWALGVTLYSMIFGSPPFSEHFENGCEISNVYRFSKLIQTEDIKLTGTVISPNLKDLFQKIFVRDPEKRITISGIMNHPWLK